MELDYNKIIKFAEQIDYKLSEFQKVLLKAICEKRQIIMPRQHGRTGVHELLLKYHNVKDKVNT